MWILDANRLDMHRNTYEWEIIRTWDLRIAARKEAWITRPIETNRIRVNSELIPEANRPRDASSTKSVKVNCNEFIIRELAGNQSRHQWDLISYLPIELIDNYRDDSIVRTPQRIASSAMPKLVLLQFTVDDSQLTMNRHIARTKCTYGGSGRVYEIRTSHVDLHRRRQLKSRLPSTWLNGIIYVTDDVRS